MIITKKCSSEERQVREYGIGALALAHAHHAAVHAARAAEAVDVAAVAAAVEVINNAFSFANVRRRIGISRTVSQ